MIRLHTDKHGITTEVSFDKSKASKLSRRIFLPFDLQKEVQEERFIVSTEDRAKPLIAGFLDHYNRKSGWIQCWLDCKAVVLEANCVEVIKRRHKLGNYILFRVWKTDNKSKGAGE